MTWQCQWVYSTLSMIDGLLERTVWVFETEVRPVASSVRGINMYRVQIETWRGWTNCRMRATGAREFTISFFISSSEQWL